MGGPGKNSTYAKSLKLDPFEGETGPLPTLTLSMFCVLSQNYQFFVTSG